MSPRHLIVTVGLAVNASSASAGVDNGPFGVIGLGALGLGTIAGLFCGYKGLSHRIGLGWSLLFIFAVTFVLFLVLGVGIIEALYWVLVPTFLVGLVPLAVTYFPTYALAETVKRRLRPSSVTPATTAGMSTNSTPHTDAKLPPN